MDGNELHHCTAKAIRACRSAAALSAARLASLCSISCALLWQKPPHHFLICFHLNLSLFCADTVVFWRTCHKHSYKSCWSFTSNERDQDKWLFFRGWSPRHSKWNENFLWCYISFLVLSVRRVLAAKNADISAAFWLKFDQARQISFM